MKSENGVRLAIALSMLPSLSSKGVVRYTDLIHEQSMNSRPRGCDMYICTQNENFQLEYGFYLTTNNNITTNNTTTNDTTTNSTTTNNTTKNNNIIHTCIPLVVYQ